MKRTLLLFSALMLSCIALWAHDVEIDGIYYNLNKTKKTAQVTYYGSHYVDYDEYSGSVTIPETITYNSETYSVTSIYEAFSGCSRLTSVTIPNSVTAIGYAAFYGCSGLTSVTIPNSVTYIGSDAFSNCSGLTSVTIPNTVTYIDEEAFYDTGIYNNNSNWDNGVLYIDNCLIDAKSDVVNGSYTIKEGTRVIASYAFAGCNGLTSVIIPNSVTTIDSFTFYNCSRLTSVTIGESVTAIDGYAFFACSKLSSVIWNAKNYKDFRYSSDSPFYDIRSSITSFTFGNEVEHIPAYLCYKMSKLSEVTIPNSVTSIGYEAFYDCSGLTKVNYLGNVDKWVEIDFNGYDSNPTYYAKDLYINNKLLADVKITTANSIKKYAFYNCQSIKSVEIGNSVTSIGSSAFSRCSGLTSVTIPNSVTSIGSSAFSHCSGLTSVTIPNSVKSIGDDAFYGCSGLKFVTIPNSVTSIGKSAFYDCSGLTSVTIPNSVTSIGDKAFNGCSGLTSVVWNAKNYKDFSMEGSPFYPIRSNITSFTFGNEVEYIPSYLCSGMDKLTEVTIPNSVTSIGGGAFYNCSGLTSITIPNSVKSIGDDAFYGCSGLTSVTIPNSVTSIGGGAFYNCSGLTSITIPNSVKSIGDDAFYGCSGLTSVIWNAKNYKDFKFEYHYKTPFYNIRSNITSFTFGNEVEHIPAYLCRGMGNLKKVTIGESVTSIGESAFEYCRGLTSITIPNSVTSIGEYAFSDCSGLTSVTIGESVTSIGGNAFQNCGGLTKVNYLGTVEEWAELDFYNNYSNPTYCAKKLYINNELLTDVKITEVKSIKDCAFYNCNSIKSVEIGNGVTSIGHSAFYGCSGLTSVTIPNSVTSIDGYAFSGCSGLTSVTIPNSVTSIDGCAFSGCSGLTSVTIPNSVTAIGCCAFEDCSGLTSVAIPNNVTQIFWDAFKNCSGLKSVSIGESVNTIGSGAFAGCDNLKKITMYPTTVPSVYENSFAHYNAYLYVPCDVYEDYDLDDVFGNFKYVKCIAADEVDAPDKVEIDVDNDNNATITWPSTDGAKSYELEITKNGNIFCTLLFNEDGQLTSIDFGNRSASVGFQFTVTGLDSASKYAYSMVAMDKKGNELQSYKGTFTTNGYVSGPGEEDEPSAIIETLADANITVSGGMISADKEFSIYNTLGKDVTALNGSLLPGIYVITLDEDRVKVMVK